MMAVKSACCEPCVLVLGYSMHLEGGVSKVTALLIDNMPELTLHPILFSYNSLVRSAWETSLSLASYLFKLMSPGKYRIVQVLVGSPGDAIRVLPFIVIARLFGCKICIQFHKSTDVILDGINSAVFRRMVRNAWRHADLLCFLSKRLKSIHEEICQDDVPKAVIPNLIDERWLGQPPLRYAERSRDIVFLGRWSWEKGVHDLIDVMENIDIDVSCDFFTDAPGDASYRNCRFGGWVGEDEVIDVIRSAKLLVLPSYAEAYPTVLLEACASGTPFVATNIAGIPDIVEQSRAGILVESGDREAMAGAITALLTNSEQWQQCSTDGRNWSCGRSNDRIVAAWRSAYRDLSAGM